MPEALTAEPNTHPATTTNGASDPSPPRTPAAPREEVRDALLEAVGRLIRRYGYRKTSVEDIAREAGVSRATTYLYFNSKEALVCAWMEQRDRHRIEVLRDLAAQSGSAGERVASLLLARVMNRFDDAQPYTESMDELLASLRPQVLAQRDRHHEAEATVVADLVREGIRDSEFPASSDPLVTARLLILATNSLLPYSLTARDLGERDEVEARARGLIRLLLSGARHGGE